MGVSSSVQDRYFVQKVKLGEGAFGKVWRAVDRQNGELVAVKQLDKDAAARRGVTKEMITREISAMQAVSHQNVTRYFGSWEDRNSLFLVLEYCDGGDFGDKLSERGLDLKEAAAAEWMRQIISAIASLHGKCICHRDIKPDNFMVHGTQVKLSDFGLAIYLPKGRLLQSKCGTPAFMAPEQHRLPRSKGYDHGCDVWAAGVTMYMVMLGGKHPFMSADGRQLHESPLLVGRLDFEVGGIIFSLGSESRYSSDARHLCRRLACPNSSKRISAGEACQHAWLQRFASSAGTSVKPLRAEAKTQRPKKASGTSKGRTAELCKQIQGLQTQLKMQQEQNETQWEALIENQRLMKELFHEKDKLAVLSEVFGSGSCAAVKPSPRQLQPSTMLPSPRVQVLQPGLKCHYYSAAVWQASKVQSWNPETGTFDLTSEEHVMPTHIRPAPEACEAEAWPAGTGVVYKSNSSSDWLPAIIMSFNVGPCPGGHGTYNLDVRDCASCERIRPRLPPFS